ncbi:IclR family transcriptional regulator [Oceanobacter mangrovi]|uniref:IclR family transcriptional regulator n=1 Tax=Oceanobacter mangrovi TaxID=2862510 RepID=UPI001C8DDD04|nr:IclR family transcriptional regulator [Oceanobacter mangrovi]
MPADTTPTNASSMNATTTNSNETATPPEHSVPAVQRAIRLLRYIGSGRSCRNLTSAAADLAINRTTLMRLLATLKDEGLIATIPSTTSNSQGGYRLSWGVLELSQGMNQQQALLDQAQPVLEQLAEQCGMSAYLAVADGGYSLYLARAIARGSLVSNLSTGTRLPLYRTSVGRALLAAMTVEEASQRLQQLPPEHTADIAPTQVLDELTRDRAAGLSWSLGRYEANVGSCAIALCPQANQPIAAINLVGPGQRFVDQPEDVADALRRAAAEILAVIPG